MSEKKTSLPSISSAEDSPARTLVLPGDDLELSEETDLGSGMSTHESFANYDQDTSSWRTSQASFLTGWELFSGSWPRSGTMLNGVCYLRAPLALHTHAPECSSWPTPNAVDHKGGRMAGRPGELKHRIMHLFASSAPRKTLYPHPSFVEAMMGFLVGHTELEHSAMQSIPIVRSGSDDE